MKSLIYLGLLLISSTSFGLAGDSGESHPDFDLSQLQFLKVESPDNGYGFISVDFVAKNAKWWTPTAAGDFEKMEFNISKRTITLTLGEPNVAEKEVVTLVLNDDLSAIYSDGNYESGRAEYVRSKIDCGEADSNSYYLAACGFTKHDAVIAMIEELLKKTPHEVILYDALTPLNGGTSFSFKGVGQYGLEVSGNIAIGTPRLIQTVDSATGLKKFQGYRVFWRDETAKSLELRDGDGQVIHQESAITVRGDF